VGVRRKDTDSCEDARSRPFPTTLLQARVQNFPAAGEPLLDGMIHLIPGFQDQNRVVDAAVSCSLTTVLGVRPFVVLFAHKKWPWIRTWS
jgi:hypothetical protein